MSFDRSLDWHRQNGKYCVKYPDGNYSQPFMLEAARGYRDIFGGDVVRLPIATRDTDEKGQT